MRILGLAVVLAVACGASHDKGAASGDAAKGSSGARCVEQANAPRKPPKDAPEHMDFGQILVRHAEARSAKGATRTREEACLRAEQARQKLLGGAEWDAVYKEFSDSQGATEGTLYDVTQGSLEPAFANAAFALQVDELSYVVETPRGFHVIWRKK